MIVCKIKVKYDYNYRTKEYCLNAADKYGAEYEDDLSYKCFWTDHDYEKDSNDPTKSPNRKRFWSHQQHTFNHFTNQGKISKTELHGIPSNLLSLIKPVAENKLKRVLKLEKTTTADTKKALQLINIINQANWDNLTAHDLAVIKAKSSHSRWYTSGLGSMHQPSEYLTVVPVSVAKEAKLMQKIRRKHQNDPTFDFDKTSYNCREIRVADHENSDGFCYFDSLLDDWHNTFNTDFLNI